MRRVVVGAILTAMLITVNVPAAEKGWATAYCLTGKTASGTQTTEGRTVAGRRADFGKPVHIWLDDGDGIIKTENYLGSYVIEDTGGENIQAGRVLDIYMENEQDCKQFGGRKIIYIVEER